MAAVTIDRPGSSKMQDKNGHFSKLAQYVLGVFFRQKLQKVFSKAGFLVGAFSF